MDPTRRLVVRSAAATLAVHLAGGSAASTTPAGASATALPADAQQDFPPLPATRTPGQPGDFRFLDGHWQIQHWRRRPSEPAWDHFEGEATCWSILEGVGSVEELRIPARQFSGMGLRLLDMEKRVWNDHWVNAQAGVIGAAGLPGSFENGAGVFDMEDRDAHGPMRVLSLWDRIGEGHCRWRQAVSRDDGRTWDANWVMHWTRTRAL